MGIGAMQQQQLLQQQQMQQQAAAAQQVQQAQPAQPAQPAGMPDVMTPEQAAAILQVSREDVVVAIEAGDLKARKIGNAYRISKANMEAFLAG